MARRSLAAGRPSRRSAHSVRTAAQTARAAQIRGELLDRPAESHDNGPGWGPAAQSVPSDRPLAGVVEYDAVSREPKLACAIGFLLAGVLIYLIFDRAEAIEGVAVYHAGTARRGKDLVTSGGRVLTVVGRGDDFAEAITRAYAGVMQIAFDGMQYRGDIGKRALKSEI